MGRIPERRQKVENARILSDYIGEERPIVSVEYAPEKSSIWQRFTGLVGGRTPAFAYGMAAMLAILTLSTSVLIVQNQRKNSELAGLQASQKRQEELQKELDSLSQREGELQNMIDSEREASGDLNEELQQEKTRRERIEQELAHLKKAHDVSAPTQRDPIIATFFLSPTVVGRGGNGGQIKNIAVGPGTMRIAVQLGLPDPVKAGERFSVNLNNRSIAHNLTTRTAASGSKSIQLTILPADLGAGRNTLGVVDASGTEISTYSFDFQKKK